MKKKSGLIDGKFIANVLIADAIFAIIGLWNVWAAIIVGVLVGLLYAKNLDKTVIGSVIVGKTLFFFICLAIVVVLGVTVLAGLGALGLGAVM
jgi:hypothetical protein